MTAGQVRHLTRTGAWTRLLPEIYLSASANLTWETWAYAAQLAGGPSATLIGTTAAALRNLHPRNLPIWLAAPPHRRLRLGTRNIRVFNLEVPQSERAKVDGLVTTSRLRTAVDVAHLLPLGEAQQLLDRMLLLDAALLDALTAAVADSQRQGSAQARRLVRSAADLAASEAERIAHRLLRQANVTGWTSNYRVTVRGRTLIIDIAFVAIRIAVEIKGWRYHSAPDRGRTDDRRTSDLQLAGWMVLTFGWYELTVTPDVVLAEIRDAVTKRVAA